MVYAFGSSAGLCCWFGGQGECRKCGLVLAVSETPAWFTSISPHAGLCLSLPHCVLFSSGDLEVSDSAIQIHCARYILCSNPSTYPLLFPQPPHSSSLLSFYSASLFLSHPKISSQLIFSHLLSNPVCTILQLSPVVHPLPDHITLWASPFLSPAFRHLCKFSFLSLLPPLRNLLSPLSHLSPFPFALLLLSSHLSHLISNLHILLSAIFSDSRSTLSSSYQYSLLFFLHLVFWTFPFPRPPLSSLSQPFLLPPKPNCQTGDLNVRFRVHLKLSGQRNAETNALLLLDYKYFFSCVW